MTVRHWLSVIWVAAKHGPQMARTLSQIHELPEYAAESAADEVRKGGSLAA